MVDLDGQPWSDDRANYLFDDHHLNEDGHTLLGDLLRPRLAHHVQRALRAAR